MEITSHVTFYHSRLFLRLSLQGKPPPSSPITVAVYSVTMPQNEYIERWTKQHGKRLDHDERVRKREAREAHKQSKDAQNLRGLRAKLYQQKRHAEKIQMRKRIKAQEEKNVKSSAPDEPSKTPLPQYLLDRSQATNAKALSSAIKDKRAEKAAKFAVPLPKVKGISEEEMFKVVNTGKKTHKKSWKRMITKPTFVGNDFTRRPVKYERFIRPMGLRYKKANVTHPEMAVTVQLPILSVKKNPQNPLYTQLGVLTKGTIIEVNVSELGIVTAGGKVAWGKYAQVTNTPENDGCVNAVLLV
ncbi:rRNA-processing protein NSA2 [Aspergillus lucknowensis]|uniref:Ribosome biogenesis protein NSA2 homolog n=1 Tax=Aspergillus lucknowensis TaxID=176173 RepID=A0ABR4LRG6_9EURO